MTMVRKTKRIPNLPQAKIMTIAAAKTIIMRITKTAIPAGMKTTAEKIIAVRAVVVKTTVMMKRATKVVREGEEKGVTRKIVLHAIGAIEPYNLVIAQAC